MFGVEFWKNILSKKTLPSALWTIVCALAASLHAFPALAFDARQSTPLNPVPQVEPGKVKLVPLASLPPALKEVVEQELQGLKKGNGVLYTDMSGEEAQQMKQLRQRLRPLADVEGNVKVPLADLSRTALASYPLQGAVPDGPSRQGPWSSVARIFERPDGALVTLHEWDFVADGGGVLSVRELMNASVHGQPAQFAVRRAPGGETVSELRWFAPTRIFTLSVSEDVQAAAKPYDRAWLTGIAEAIGN